MRHKNQFLSLLFIMLLLNCSTCYGRGFSQSKTHQATQNDQIIYMGTVTGIESSTLHVNISGPGCNGSARFKRSHSSNQVAYNIGDTISFFLSGECSNEESIITVEGRR